MSIRRPIVSIVAALGLAVLGACGGSGDNGSGGGGTTTVSTVEGEVPYATELESSGFRAVWLQRFPAQVPGRKARVLAYRASSGDRRGGLMYLSQFGEEPEQLVWHWYFSDQAPDSVSAVELNDDGLWDMRVYMSGGDKVDLVQEKDFTLVRGPRKDLIASNGEASYPEDAWRIFDGDTVGVWKNQGGDSWVDVPTPLGVDAGVVTVHLGRDDQPQKIEIDVNGKKVKDYDLKPTTDAQIFQIGRSGQDISDVRLVFKARGENPVAVSEVEIR